MVSRPGMPAHQFQVNISRQVQSTAVPRSARTGALPRIALKFQCSRSVSRIGNLLYIICRVTFWECDREPLVAVIVNVKVPCGVVGGCCVMMSNPDVPEPVTGAGGIGNWLAPGNNPVTLKSTVPLNPFRASMVMV